MKDQISNLRKFIEVMREELIHLGNNRKSFTDPDVVKLSQKLDRLLDKYQELQYNLKCEITWFEWFESDYMQYSEEAGLKSARILPNDIQKESI